MHFITLKTNVSLRPDQIALLQSKFEQDIRMLPYKDSQDLMISVQGDIPISLKGMKSPAAIIEVISLSDGSHEGFDRFSQALTNTVQSTLFIDPTRIYILFLETESWAFAGHLIDLSTHSF